VSVYRVGWLTVALSLGVVGLGVALVLLQAALLVLLPCFAVASVLVALLFPTDSEEGAPWSRTRRLSGVALLSGAAAGALAGFAALVGGGAFLVAVLVLASSPRSLRTCRRWMGSLPSPTAEDLDGLARSLAYTNPAYMPVEPAPDLCLLSDDQLCQAWRDSQTAVRSPSTRRSFIRAVEERGRYLEEFERRQPSLLRAWLASDAGAPDNPLSDPAASRLEPPIIDWDELTGGQANDR
jgi:hypothetical protein